jgi:branched-chain amino acid transport system ATP-binding protein
VLEVRALTVHYGKALALEGVEIDVPAHTLVAVIGPNGAGKTTLLRTISGLLEGRRPFPEIAVLDNLRLGTPLWPSSTEAKARLDEVFQLFPRLRERQSQLAGTLSGGEQQMLALGRALMCRPKLLLLDEPSMGLAPKVVDEVYGSIGKIRAMGVTVLLVEQNVELALEVCDTLAVLDRGRLVFNGKQDELTRNTTLKEIYLGLA